MVAADDLEQRIRDIHAKISYNLDAIPVANWGFSEQVRDALKQRKHALVNQQLTASACLVFPSGSLAQALS